MTPKSSRSSESSFEAGRMNATTHPARWLVDVIADRLGDGIEEDRIIDIPDRENQLGYVDTEGCKVYLITVQEAHLVPASNQESEPKA
jgi:hypothetical protein